MAISIGLDVVLSKQEQALVQGLDERQIAKLILDNAMSAWSYEDLVSNQLGVKFFEQHGAFVNAGADPAEVRQRFIDRMTSFFADIRVVNDAKRIKRLGASLPGKERWTSRKMDEAKARRRFPELFQFTDRTHRIRVAVYDRADIAERQRTELASLVPSAPGLRVEPYRTVRHAIYTDPMSRFAAVILKRAIDRAMPTGPGGALVEEQPAAAPAAP